MAGDWIKMRSNLWDDPRVARLCDLTDKPEATVLGGLYWLWATADQHTEDGRLPGMSLRAIDRKTGVEGLGQALHDVGWIAEEGDGVVIVRFEEHNGSSAKRRATEAKRKANVRKVSASDADKAQTESGGRAELEKEKEVEKEESVGTRAGALRKPDYLDTQVWNDFRSYRTSKKAKLTPTAWSRIETELQRGIDQGHDPNDMLGEAMEAGWTGFKVEWYENRVGKKPAATTAEKGSPEYNGPLGKVLN